MNVACLGWGSLIWDPRTLPVRGPWREDGPRLPIEFARQSSDGRLTLVIVPDYPYFVPVLWTLLSTATVDEARTVLGRREGVGLRNVQRSIGLWSDHESAPAACPGMPAWAAERMLGAVVWTALTPGCGTDIFVVNVDEAEQYLRQLPCPIRQCAEEYVRRAPRQVDTPYRRRFEAALGWMPLGL